MNKYELLSKILNDVREDMTDEELIHKLIEKRISFSDNDNETLSQRASDRMAAFAGSWTFIISFTLVLIIWIITNAYLLKAAFDPYPFVLLNLVLSCVAAIQAPLIMMSQKRQEEKDRQRAENDYRVNLKCEIILEDLHRKLDRIIEKTDDF